MPCPSMATTSSSPTGAGTASTNDLPNLLVQSLSIASSHTVQRRGDPAAERHHADAGVLGASRSTLDLPHTGRRARRPGRSRDPCDLCRRTANGTIDLVNAQLDGRCRPQNRADLGGIISGAGGLTWEAARCTCGGPTRFKAPAEITQGSVYSAPSVGPGCRRRDGREWDGHWRRRGCHLPDGTLPPEAFQLTLIRMFGCQDGAQCDHHGPGDTRARAAPGE